MCITTPTLAVLVVVVGERRDEKGVWCTSDDPPSLPASPSLYPLTLSSSPGASEISMCPKEDQRAFQGLSVGLGTRLKTVWADRQTLDSHYQKSTPHSLTTTRHL
ncbi:hypothetical protein Pmani_031483 [Petrolisthes manimaculis]|uniref:Uncharacterized protein n=1 Tax=Petrolisthes manimaculis TaxID=1843537 RepID=A0AAE1NTP9_9EUCA|nr:hypothetical protein Pmani_031483 [Petrolisthes manimaculis]